MTNTDNINQIRHQNTELLWEILNAYFNDFDGITKHEILELVDFDLSENEDHDVEAVFDRALKSCRKRAEKAGWIIPRAVVKEGRGFAYVLTDRADLVIDGYIAQNRIAQGVERSTHKHEAFIKTHAEDLPPTMRVLFEKMSAARAEYTDILTQKVKDHQDDLTAVMDAVRMEKQLETAQEPI